MIVVLVPLQKIALTVVLVPLQKIALTVGADERFRTDEGDVGDAGECRFHGVVTLFPTVVLGVRQHVVCFGAPPRQVPQGIEFALASRLFHPRVIEQDKDLQVGAFGNEGFQVIEPLAEFLREAFQVSHPLFSDRNRFHAGIGHQVIKRRSFSLATFF